MDPDSLFVKYDCDNVNQAIGGASTAVPGTATEGWVTYHASDGTVFTLPQRYDLRQLLGKGAYGVVCSAFDRISQQLVAVKKVVNCFGDLRRAQRVVRELNIMATLRYHPKICGLLDIIIPPATQAVSAMGDDGVAPGGNDDLYFIMELVDTDLAGVFKKGPNGQAPAPLSMSIIQYVTKQLVQALAAMHRVPILHRDLTPRNVLLTTAVKVRLADFGLAREVEDGMSQYVVTRHYRSPEIMFGFQGTRDESYTPHHDRQMGCDVWSLGCIVAELLGQGRVLLRGDNYVQQVTKAIELIGSPDPSEYAWAPAEVRRWLDGLPRYPSRLHLLETMFQLPPDATPEDRQLHSNACDFIRKCLVFSPERRMSAEAALSHPYVDDGYGSVDDIIPEIDSASPPRALPPHHPIPTIEAAREAIPHIQAFIRVHPCPARRVTGFCDIEPSTTAPMA